MANILKDSVIHLRTPSHYPTRQWMEADAYDLGVACIWTDRTDILLLFGSSQLLPTRALWRKRGSGTESKNSGASAND